MDDAKNTAADIQEDLLPPSQSRLSIILNGAGNGMMMGAVPFFGLEMRERIGGPKVPKGYIIASGFATVIGAAVGAIYGAHEAKIIDNYRTSSSNTLLRLNAKVAEQQKQLDSWEARLKAEPKGEEKVASRA